MKIIISVTCIALTWIFNRKHLALVTLSMDHIRMLSDIKSVAIHYFHTNQPIETCDGVTTRRHTDWPAHDFNQPKVRHMHSHHTISKCDVLISCMIIGRRAANKWLCQTMQFVVLTLSAVFVLITDNIVHCNSDASASSCQEHRSHAAINALLIAFFFSMCFHNCSSMHCHNMPLVAIAALQIGNFSVFVLFVGRLPRPLPLPLHFDFPRSFFLLHIFATHFIFLPPKSVLLSKIANVCVYRFTLLDVIQRIFLGI